MATIRLVTDYQKQHALKVLSETECGKNFEVVIRKVTRSNAQNALFHKWCGEIAQASGCYSPDDIKIAMKKQFGVWAEKEVHGESITVMKSTAKYNTLEMNRLMNGVYLWGCEHGVELSNPDDLGRVA